MPKSSRRLVESLIRSWWLLKAAWTSSRRAGRSLEDAEERRSGERWSGPVLWSNGAARRSDRYGGRSTEQYGRRSLLPSEREAAAPEQAFGATQQDMETEFEASTDSEIKLDLDKTPESPCKI
ncbi:hypothetical protein L596_023814 [Steinernema carpocapsae]|uniref:Uncharacterized protein n=1 Tax=Steinernema carpocapsae TaxID=34508 RepID=A0A4U5MET2_STECR|nr:hypothetical protein L596_023814 [Steinernema carpocapsae]